MNKKNSDWLHKNFPKLYVHAEKDGRKKYIRKIGFECGDGWFPIIKGLSIAIQNYIDTNHRKVETIKEWNALIASGGKPDWWDEDKHGKPTIKKVPKLVKQVIVSQLKEKFGTLRYYHNNGDETIENFIQMAEIMSSIVCEKCSKPGSIITGNWIVTLCPTCAKKKKLLFDEEREALANLKSSLIDNHMEVE